MLGRSSKTLSRYAADGYFREGVHFLRGPHPQSPKVWDVPACIEVLTALSAPASPPKKQAE